MDQNHWNKIESILDNVLSLPQKQRRPYIINACNGDITLIDEVTDLLDAIAISDKTHFLQDISTENKAFLDDLKNEPLEIDFIGRRIGVFEISETIGSGGMGHVFRAVRVDGEFDQHVAIKLVRRGFDSEETLKRFQLERQILADLTHPNIARLYDGGFTDEGHPYLVMEYINGMPIDAYCNHHSLTIPERLKLFKQVCKAVEFAHRNLIIHRDLKAQNIYVTSDGLVKVLDFGIAKLLDPELQPEELLITQPGRHLWTPHYAAPEQVREDTVTTATDVYSLGILLHKLITDRFPFDFDGKSLTQIKSIITNNRPGNLSQSLQHETSFEEAASQRSVSVNEMKKIANSDLAAIVYKTIRRLPEYRYNSIGQFVDDITNYENNLPVSAKSNKALYRVNAFFKRHKAAFIVGALTLLMLSVFAGVYAFRITNERNEAQAEANKAKTVTSFLIGLFDASDPTEAHGDTTTARELLRRGLKKAEGLRNQPAVQSQMYETIGRVYRRLGKYKQARKLLEKALEIHKKEDGLYSKETAGSMDQLGILLTDEGSYQSAESLLHKALHIRTPLQSAHNPDVATTQNLLAYALRKQGKYDEAERYYRSSLQIRKEYYGDNHPLTIASMSSLGAVLHNKGEYKSTEKLYRRVLKQRRKLLGPVHPDIAMSLNNLGALTMNTGRYKEAKGFFGEALKMRQKIYGPVHPKVALTINNLAMVSYEMNDFSSAESLFTKALKMRIKVLGDNHVATALSKFGLAELMLATDRPDTALALFKQAQKVFKKKLSPNHSFIARTKMDIGRAEFARGYPEKAEKMLLSGYQDIKKIHPDSSLERALAENQLGIYYFNRGAYDQSAKLLHKAFRTLQLIEGNGSNRQNAILAYLSKIQN